MFKNSTLGFNICTQSVRSKTNTMKNQNVFKTYSPRHHMWWCVAQCRDCSHKKEDDLYKDFKINLSFQKFAIGKLYLQQPPPLQNLPKRYLNIILIFILFQLVCRQDVASGLRPPPPSSLIQQSWCWPCAPTHLVLGQCSSPKLTSTPCSPC